MIQTSPYFSKRFLLQIFLFLFINGLFIFKYLTRVNVNPFIIITFYSAFVLLLFFMAQTYSCKISEKTCKILLWLLLILMILAIVCSLILIDRYTVRVDRWSAVTFFLDNLFQGKYPYSAHTHVSTTNFASPFPVWHIINIPFYLLGDVGIGLIFFLLLTVVAVQYFFKSYQKSFFFLLLLLCSPAYWWEVAVRSDSLSNALLVFIFIIWFNRMNYSLAQNFWICVVACGLIASTRLTAVLPIALFFFKPFVELSWKQKFKFVSGILVIFTLTFCPYIFWDTTNWIFFSRNPFLSQTSVGNPYLLIMLIVLGCWMAYKWKRIAEYFEIVSIFIFIFVLSSQLSLIFTRGIHGDIFSDSLYDVSYFTLCLAYCLVALINFTFQNSINHVKKKI